MCRTLEILRAPRLVGSNLPRERMGPIDPEMRDRYDNHLRVASQSNRACDPTHIIQVYDRIDRQQGVGFNVGSLPAKCFHQRRSRERS